MKFKPAFTLIPLFSFLAFVSTSVFTYAADATIEGKEIIKPRWFEIEVILFNQLTDKNKLKENFPDITKSSKPSKFFDLISSYLYPDISGLKIHLLSCDASIQEQKEFNHPSFNIPNEPLFLIKTLDELFQSIQKEVENKLETESLNSGAYLNSANDNLQDQIKNNIEMHYSKVNSTKVNNSKINNKKGNSLSAKSIPIDYLEATSGLTDKEVALLNAAELYFSKTKPNNYTRYPSFKVNQKINPSICVIPKSYFQSILTPKELRKFDINGFPVEQTPLVIDATELSNLNNPYLISKDALQLKDIVTQLRWSKEFKPLMHLGWRQIGVTRRKAIPLKFYAGDNLDYTYQQALIQRRLNESNAISESIQDEANQLMNNLSLNNAQQQHINRILTDISSINHNDIETILSELNSVVIDQGLLNKNEDIISQANIEPPIQSWNLEGFFKVHLDHYLYITADFNILNTAIADDTEKRPKIINFSQDRRVISGEIHYFDHPYIGMIVQIRRFDPDKPADQAVTQAIK